jgi:hypothetical protein
MKNSNMPRLQLKIKILEKYGRQFLAAKDFGIRDDVLSAILSGRKDPKLDLIELMEKKLKCRREDVGL